MGLIAPAHNAKKPLYYVCNATKNDTNHHASAHGCDVWAACAVRCTGNALLAKTRPMKKRAMATNCTARLVTKERLKPLHCSCLTNVTQAR